MTDKNLTERLVVLVTVPSGACGESIGRALVKERLAACVNLVSGVRSIYRDAGEVQEADEVLLVIKTRCEAYAALEARVRALHPYQTPEVIAVPVSAGAASYLAWLDQAVGSASVRLEE